MTEESDNTGFKLDSYERAIRSGGYKKMDSVPEEITVSVGFDVLAAITRNDPVILHKSIIDNALRAWEKV